MPSLGVINGPQYGFDFEDGERVILGHGTSGVTYQGWVKLETGEVIRAALKQINDVGSGGTYSLQREVQLLGEVTSGVQDLGLVRFLDVFYVESSVIIATQLVEGFDLATITAQAAANGQLAQSAWTVKVLTWARGIAASLSRIHSKKILHLDIKPANVLIESSSGQQVLIDFGLGRQEQSKTRMAQLRVRRPSLTSSLPFFSPEQLCPGLPACTYCESNPCVLEERTDIYSLGATIWFALTNSYPIPFEVDEKNLNELANRKRSRAIPVNPLVGQEIYELISQMLNADPANRPTAPKLVGRIDTLLGNISDGNTALEAAPLLPPPNSNALESSNLPEFAAIRDQVEIARHVLADNFKAFWQRASGSAGASRPGSGTPIAHTSLADALSIIEAINKENQSTGWIYRLPTPDEWILAAGFVPGERSDLLVLPPIFEDASTEHEWCQEQRKFRGPGDAAILYYVTDGGYKSVTRHPRWPKGVIRLVRQKQSNVV